MLNSNTFHLVQTKEVEDFLRQHDVKTYRKKSFIRFETLELCKYQKKTKIIHFMKLHEFKTLNNKLQPKYKNASNLLVLFHYIMTMKRGNELHATLNVKCIYFYTSWKLRILSVGVYRINIRFIYMFEKRFQ